jgi:uncharacterized protein (TIGR02391 family)
MIAFLNSIIDIGEDLLIMYDHAAYEGIQDDIYLEVITKSRLFFRRLKDDPFNLKKEIDNPELDNSSFGNLNKALRILKKAFCYFEVPDDEEDTFWIEIHPLIRGISKEKFDRGFYADAVESAFKEVNNILKADYKLKSGKELDGASLMNTIFSVNNPVYVFDTMESDTGRNIQQGYMQIFAGAMTGIRNPKAHNNMMPDKNKTIHLLFIASFMTVKIEELGLI